MSTGIKEIAQVCGLSTNSVSDILNRGKRHLYRPETCERVVRVAAELNYRPNRAARAMRSSRSQAVGFLAFNMSAGGMLDNYSVYPFVVGMSHYFTDRGYHVSLVEMKEMQAGEPGQLPEVLRERYFDGLVLHYGVPQNIRDLLAQNEVPVIWWDAGVFEEFDCIYRDETSVGRELTNRLIKLGHRQIAFMVGHNGWKAYQSGEYVHFSYKQRYEAYRAEMLAHGLEPLHIVGYDFDSVAAQLCGQNVTAVVTMGSDRLQSLTRPCLDLRWCIPEDLTVATCDTEVRRLHAQLSSGGISYDRYETGQRAAAMLHAKIEQPDTPQPSEQILGEFSQGTTIAEPADTSKRA